MGRWVETLETMYIGEVMGEALFNHIVMANCGYDPLAAACLLQLETEAKVYLRPHVIAAGLSVAELPETRAEGVRIIEPSTKLPIGEQLALLRDVVRGFIPIFEGYLADAHDRGIPTEIEICEFMLEHEKVQLEYAVRALEGGDQTWILEPLQSFLKTPLPHGCDAVGDRSGADQAVL